MLSFRISIGQSIDKGVALELLISEPAVRIFLSVTLLRSHSLSVSLQVSEHKRHHTCNSSSCPEGNENERVTGNEMSVKHKLPRLYRTSFNRNSALETVKEH